MVRYPSAPNEISADPAVPRKGHETCLFLLSGKKAAVLTAHDSVTLAVEVLAASVSAAGMKSDGESIGSLTRPPDRRLHSGRTTVAQPTGYPRYADMPEPCAIEAGFSIERGSHELQFQRSSPAPRTA